MYDRLATPASVLMSEFCDTPAARASHTASLSLLSALRRFAPRSSMALTIPQFAEDYATNVDNDTRREKGRNHVSSLMIWWFAKNEWSHPIFSELSDWALNEKGSVHPSQLSHIRNRKMRMMGLKVLDAFGAVNLGVWAFQQDRNNPEKSAAGSLLARLGCSVVTSNIESWIENATVIINPVTGQPLDQGGFMATYLGYIKIPGVINGAVQNNSELENLAKACGKYLQHIITQSDKNIWDCGAIASQIFQDETRSRKFVAVATGLDSYSGIEIQRDITEICILISGIRGQEVSPEMLVNELTAFV